MHAYHVNVSPSKIHKCTQSVCVRRIIIIWRANTPSAGCGSHQQTAGKCSVNGLEIQLMYCSHHEVGSAQVLPNSRAQGISYMICGYCLCDPNNNNETVCHRVSKQIVSVNY